MDDSIQELEFLDFAGVDDDVARDLRSLLIEDGVSPAVGKSEPQPPNSVVEGLYEDERQPYEDSVAPDVNIPITTMSYHLQHPGANTLVNHPAVYGYLNHQPVVSYPIQGVYAPGGPNYYVPSGPGPGFPSAHHQMMNNSPTYGGYHQGGHKLRKSGGGGRSKYSPRKEVPNGHHHPHSGDPAFYHHTGPPYQHNGPYFPNNLVQAATGVPIVMHHPQPSYIQALPPAPIPGGGSSVVYRHPVVAYAQSPVPPEVDATLSAQPVQPPPPETVIATPVSIEPVVMVVERAISPVVSSEPPRAVTPPPASHLPPVVAASAPGAEAEKAIAAPEVESETPVTAEVSEEPVQAEQSGGKSWASLFKKAAPAAPAGQVDKPTARVEPFTATSPNVADAGAVNHHPKPAAGADTGASSASPRRPVVNVKTRRLAEHLSTYEIVTSPVPLLPRGLINKGNWCYINATLQALIACPPFVHLIKSVAPYTNIGNKGEESTIPVIDSVVDFIDQFETVPVRKGSSKKEEPQLGSSFEPTSIYRMLSKIRSEAFKVEGRQEDAEEFLGCLLNGLHDEMIEVMKVVKGPNRPDTSQSTVPPDAKPSTPDDEDWQVIGPKNRGCVTRSTSISKTPISNLFLGMMRSALHAHSTHSSEFEPYFTLQLDIQNEKVNSVRDALACLVAKEPLTGYVCSKSGQEVEASRQTTFEELPPILILHLKCFVYDKSGGCQKLLKRIDFSADLELSKEFLSPNQKSKLKERQRQYKLFAVVYHDGKEATKGHYVTEVHHMGTGSWLRFDDSIIRVVDTQLFKYNLPRMPYLLLYRKMNL